MPRLNDGTSSHPPRTTWSLRLLVWAAVALTIYSGWGYVQTAMRLLRSADQGAGSRRVATPLDAFVLLLRAHAPCLT